MKILQSTICYSRCWESFLKAYDREGSVILKAEPQGTASLHFATVSIIKTKQKHLKKGQEW